MDDDHETSSSRGLASPDETLPSPGLLELDHVYEAMGNPRRRYVCYTLLEGGEWSLADLATRVAAWEADVPDRRVPDEHRRRLYIALYHNHVPKLAEGGIVAFDAEDETVRPGPNARDVLWALRGIESRGPPGGDGEQ
jgi:hypothetical protein